MWEFEGYELKKKYTAKERAKADKMLPNLDIVMKYSDEDWVAIINAIRPNTLKHSIAEVTTSPYYQKPSLVVAAYI